MFRDHITIALRNFVRNKVYSVINVAGMAMAFTSFTLIFLYVENELSFDRFHREPENIYRVVKESVNEDGTKVPDATTPPALAPALRQELSEVDQTTRFFPNLGRLYLLQHGDKRFYETNLMRVDTNFFKVFDFPFVSGNREESLKNIHAIL